MKYLFILFIFILILLSGIGIGVFGAKMFMPAITEKVEEIHIAATVKEILPVSECVTLVYHYADVITHSDVRKFLNVDIPFTGKKAIYTIDGAIKLGFDGNDIRIIASYNNIIVHMPEIKILSHEIFPETFNLYDEKTGLFNRYSLQNANDIQMHHKIEIESRVNENDGLYTQARQSAEQQFRSLLENLPEIKDKYKIVIEWD